MSSKASLIKLILKTKTKGPMAVAGSKGEINVIEVSTAVKRKKQFK